MSPRPQLSPAFVAQFRSKRIMEACATAVAAKGYEATIVADIVSGAKAARNTFYENFSSKADCFQATIEWVVAEAIERIETSAERFSGREARVDAGLEALLEFVNEHPHWATCALVEAQAGAPEVYQAMLIRFAKMTGLPAPIDEMVVGGVAWILYRHALGEGETDPDALLTGLREFCHNTFESVELAAR